MRLPPKSVYDLALQLCHLVPPQPRAREFSREGRLEGPIGAALAAEQAAVRVGPASIVVCGELLKVLKGVDALLWPVAHFGHSPYCSRWRIRGSCSRIKFYCASCRVETALTRPSCGDETPR